MSDGFNLIFIHKETGVEYRAKSVTRNDYIIEDPETKTKMPISRAALMNRFNSHKDNSKNQKKYRLNFKRRPEHENNI